MQWSRKNSRPLPPDSRDLNGRLEIPAIKVEHSGEYVCEAVGYPKNTPGSSVSVMLEVERCKLKFLFVFLREGKHNTWVVLRQQFIPDF